jgi:hypothetical protein
VTAATSPALTATEQVAADTDKRARTLQALLALRGHELHILADGSFLATRWGLSKALRDLAAVEQFARQVGALG